jgi:formylglycine-generating enzyme required for sulfatase activity
MSPKVEKPRAEAKTKIIYVDKSANKTQSTSKTNIEPEMVYVEGGTFSMGNAADATGNDVHSVTVSSFRMSKYEVMVVQYKAYCNATGTVMPEAPAWGWKDNYPIEKVSFGDATKYCNWLSEKTGKEYRLPTEAEWEFAAKGGNKTNNYTYSGSNNIDEVAWYDVNSGGEAQTCGRKRPNELGLYDMTGNVWEWCKDWFDSKYYSNSPSSNPRGPSSGSNRVYRGGSFREEPKYSRVTTRFSNAPSESFSIIGFRLVSP